MQEEVIFWWKINLTIKTMNGVDVEELIILRLAGNETEGAAGGGGGDDDDDEGAGSGKSLASLKKEVDKYIGIVKEKDDQEKRANVIAIQATQVEQYTCKNCKNSDPTLFAEDSKHGEIVCMKCGVVAVQSKIFQGDYERVFEDDDTVVSYFFSSSLQISLSIYLWTKKLEHLNEFHLCKRNEIIEITRLCS